MNYRVKRIIFVSLWTTIMTFVFAIKQKQANVICNPIDINTKPYCDMIGKDMTVTLIDEKLYRK